MAARPLSHRQLVLVGAAVEGMCGRLATTDHRTQEARVSNETLLFEMRQVLAAVEALEADTAAGGRG